MRERTPADDDASALVERIRTNETYGTVDFDQWIFDHLEMAQGMSVLDLGCGTGKHTIPLAQMTGRTGRVTAVDISEEALTILSTAARESEVDGWITTHLSAFDELDMRSQEKSFDRVLSSYALYYARSPSTVLSAVHGVLKPGGCLLFCGPARDNSLEIRKFHFAVKGIPHPGDPWPVEFMERAGQDSARELFETVEVFKLENPIRLDSAEALCTYWSSYHLYDENIADAFETAAGRYFEEHPVFQITKHVLAVKAIR